MRTAHRGLLPLVLSLACLLLALPVPSYALPELVWSNVSFNQIDQGNADGTGRLMIASTPALPFGVALDTLNSKIYWMAGSSIYRANYDGSSEETVVSSVGDSYSIALDPANQKIYWTEWANDVVMRADYNGQNVTVLTTSVDGPLGIVFDAGQNVLFFVEDFNQRISRIATDGSAQTTIYTSADRLVGLARDPATGRLYFSSRESVYHIEADGTGVSTIGSNVFASALGIDIDLPNGNLYAADGGAGSIKRLPLAGGTPEALFSGNCHDIVVGAIPTPTPTITPTSSPTSTPTPAPSVAPTQTPTPTTNSSLQGRIVRANGRPAPNTIVYLSRTSGSGPGVSRLTIGSTRTDKRGNYRFSRVKNGAYEILPFMSGVSFTPALLTASPGATLPNIVARASNAASQECTVTNRARDIVSLNKAAAAQISFLSAQVRAADNRPLPDSLQAEVERLDSSARRVYSRMLVRSKGFPSRVITCSAERRCRKSNAQPSAQRYRRGIYHLHQLSFSLERLLRDLRGRSFATAERRAYIKRLYRQSLDRLGKVELQTDVCSGGAAS